MRSDRESTDRPISGDLDKVDALFTLRDRFDGLRCAIRGAAYASDADRRGLIQLADDVADRLGEVCAAITPSTNLVPTRHRRKK